MTVDIFPVQRTDMNGKLSHICVPEGNYIRATMAALQPETLRFYETSSTESSALSPSEITEIEESEREFANQNTEVYDNATDLINALHKERVENQRAHDE
jgi:hypothetical protein